MPSESISLAIGGESYAAWDSWSVESDLRTPADGFELTLHTKDTQSLGTILGEGKACTLSLGSDRVLTGHIDTVVHAVSRDGVTISVSGRDNAAVLVDCSAPPVNMRNATLDEIVRKLVQPLGIAQVDIPPDTKTPSRLVQYKPDENAWDVLKKVADSYSLWPWMEADGRLVVGGPDYSAAPVDQLTLRLDGKGNNVSSMSVRHAYSGRYNQIQVLAQHGQHDSDALDRTRGQLHAEEYDDSVSKTRKLVVTTAASTTLWFSASVRDLMLESHLNALEVQALVQGHRTAKGVVWTPGQRVIVRSEPHGLEGTFFLMSRKLSLSRTAGPTTLLRLVQDGLWKAGKIPEAFKSKAKPIDTYLEVKPK